ncbi:hypothetical protein C8R32_103299 [Nitrosospira sp. Nsp5]|uniref:Uncharacterized protein n=1 Tax=Nitrosospira multiformis TaxID=1231 RepID=A0ABY0TR93_9PROT|nr:hypothetical protein C8R32_103299 [Nitrosospira sp. Nsp5]SDR01442.1 hypothetical protein SAMN05216402_3255 [Nitrosospira multiformis]
MQRTDKWHAQSIPAVFKNVGFLYMFCPGDLEIMFNPLILKIRLYWHEICLQFNRCAVVIEAEWTCQFILERGQGIRFLPSFLKQWTQP